jgi:hypothetical protein
LDEGRIRSSAHLTFRTGFEILYTQLKKTHKLSLFPHLLQSSSLVSLASLQVGIELLVEIFAGRGGLPVSTTPTSAGTAARLAAASSSLNSAPERLVDAATGAVKDKEK